MAEARIPPIVKLDLRGVLLPACLLEFNRALKEIDRDQALEVLVNDPEVLRDFLRIARRAVLRRAGSSPAGEGFCLRIEPLA